MSSYQLITAIVAISTLLVVSIQLSFLRKALVADHERHRKHDTMTYLDAIHEKYHVQFVRFFVHWPKTLVA